ncbi:hypothetical protein FPV67DRAFT_1669159 [Lyophyllum atratum]|nr:hypothetical protein FPV67DRAFT_1669159 [Lyophyllum atratum]
MDSKKTEQAKPAVDVVQQTAETVEAVSKSTAMGDVVDLVDQMNRLDVQPNCEFCAKPKSGNGWALFPARKLSAGLKEGETSVEWVQRKSGARRIVCRACIMAAIEERDARSPWGDTWMDRWMDNDVDDGPSPTGGKGWENERPAWLDKDPSPMGSCWDDEKPDV